MNRSPLFYPLNRGMDADAGGAADLQTDVMRFMAIISMCLVAIFALVQSIPLAQVQEPPKGTPADPVPAPEMLAADTPAPIEIAETEIPELTRPEPQRPEPKPKPVALERPVMKPLARKTEAPPPVTAQATDIPEPAPADPGETRKGFSLRFASDAALKRLVASDVVGFYAIAGDDTQRMNVDGVRISFWTASAPRQFHEMDAATVPGDVLTAYRRGSPGAGVKWGVSLPGAMSSQLNRYLAELEGGSLLIGADGQLRLEP